MYHHCRVSHIFCEQVEWERTLHRPPHNSSLFNIGIRSATLNLLPCVHKDHLFLQPYPGVHCIPVLHRGVARYSEVHLAQLAWILWKDLCQCYFSKYSTDWCYWCQDWELGDKFAVHSWMHLLLAHHWELRIEKNVITTKHHLKKKRFIPWTKFTTRTSKQQSWSCIEKQLSLVYEQNQHYFPKFKT